MRFRQLLASLFVVAASVGSGALECGYRVPTAQQQRGAELYGRMCAVCHAPRGEGYAADQAPALAHAHFLASVTDEYLRNAITHGRAGTTMSSWGAERGGPLQRADVDAIIAFFRTWDRRPHAPLDERPLAGDPVKGASIFAVECSKCHGARGTEGPNVHIGDPDLLLRATNGFLRYAIRGGRSGTDMPSFGEKLGGSSVDDVVALLRTWQVPPRAAPRQPPPRPPPIPLGPVPLNPRGPEPADFVVYPGTTKADVIKAQLDRHGKMAFLDARDPAAYMNEHIEGAVSVPFYDPDPYFAGLPKDAWLIAYCSCPHAESKTLAQKLQAQGFKKVTVLDEGLGVWKMKKYGTHTGVAP